MAFNITELKSSIGKLGVQKNTTFACTITPPVSLQSHSILTDLPFRVSSANLPGVVVTTDDFKTKGFGLNESRPIGVGFDDINLTIIADAKGRVHQFLHEWLELIMPTNSEDGDADDVEFFEYPNNYYGGLEIYVYDATGEKHTTFTFTNPYVTNLGGIQMGWENVDSIMLIPVAFKFRSFRKNTSYSGVTVQAPNITPEQVERALT